MLASVEIKSRPLRLGLLVDLRDKTSIERAIEINSTVWSRFYNPLIPIFKKTPGRWTEKVFRPPKPPFRVHDHGFCPKPPKVVWNLLLQAGSKGPTLIS